MFTVFYAGKRVHGVLRGKTCSRCFDRENMFTVFCAGNIFTVFSGRRHVTGPVLRVGKYDTGVKFGKNKFEVLSAANNLTGDERRKTHASQASFPAQLLWMVAEKLLLLTNQT